MNITTKQITICSCRKLQTLCTYQIFGQFKAETWQTENERQVLPGQSLMQAELTACCNTKEWTRSSILPFCALLYPHTRHLFQPHPLHQLSGLSGIFQFINLAENYTLWWGVTFPVASKGPTSAKANVHGQKWVTTSTAESLTCISEMYLNSSMHSITEDQWSSLYLKVPAKLTAAASKEIENQKWQLYPALELLHLFQVFFNA